MLAKDTNADGDADVANNDGGGTDDYVDVVNSGAEDAPNKRVTICAQCNAIQCSLP